MAVWLVPLTLSGPSREETVMSRMALMTLLWAERLEGNELLEG